MLKKILLILVIFPFTTVFSQDTIRVKMTPVQKYTWSILYSLNGVNQKYIANATIENGAFSFIVPKDSKPGMYRILYDNNNNKFIDILYNKENITLDFHPDHPVELVKFSESEENKLYQNYIDQASTIHNRLDSLQVVYFQSDENIGKLKKAYQKNLGLLDKMQTSFNEKSKGKIAQNFIKANKRFYNKTLLKDTNIYLETLKKHYFDNVDFENPYLKKSSLLIDRVMDYVMYLNTSKDEDTRTMLRINAIEDVLKKIKKATFKKDVIESLLYTFAQQENITLVNYLFGEHFDKLPETLQDANFKLVIKDMLKASIGQKASDFLLLDRKLQENEKTEDIPTLHSLDKADFYIVVFWSSTCPHCLQELPLLQKYVTTKNNIKTIAIGLETDASKNGWKDETYYLEGFTHVLALGSDENKYDDNTLVKDYLVDSTPNFFVLNKDKTIIAKPYDVKELKNFFKLIEKDVNPKKE